MTPAPSQDSHQERPREVQNVLQLLPRQETLTLPPVDTCFPEDLRHEGDRAIQATWNRKEKEILKEGRGDSIREHLTSEDRPHAWAGGFYVVKMPVHSVSPTKILKKIVFTEESIIMYLKIFAHIHPLNHHNDPPKEEGHQEGPG